MKPLINKDHTSAQQGYAMASYVYRTVFFVVGIFLFSAIVIAGAYGLSLHAVNQNLATAKQLQKREAQSQLRAAIPTCQALKKISDDAEFILNLPGAKNPTPQNVPVIDFFGEFITVYKTSDCGKVLAFAKKNP